MTELIRSSGDSSQVERGDLPEVAELGNVLTALFNRLEVTQNAYAIRVSLDKSIVSRYLRGKRIAPRDFIDRLFKEVEQHHGAPIKPEVKAQVHKARLAALKVYDPSAFELESMRQHLERSRRDESRLRQQEEALYALLEKKESEIEQIQDELSQLRSDWAVERSEATRAEIELRGDRQTLVSEKERLIREVEDLRNRLHEAEELRLQAERDSADLKSRVRDLEEEMAATREGGGNVSQPLDVFMGELQEALQNGEVHEVARDLAEAAWARPVAEVVALVRMLLDAEDESRALNLLHDAARLRPVADIRRLADTVGERIPPRYQAMEGLADSVSTTRTIDEIVELDKTWPKWRLSGANLLSFATRNARSVEFLVNMVRAAARLCNEDALIQVARSVNPARPSASLRVLAELQEVGRSRLASQVFSRMVAQAEQLPQVSEEGPRISEAYYQLDSRLQGAVIDALKESERAGRPILQLAAILYFESEGTLEFHSFMNMLDERDLIPGMRASLEEFEDDSALKQKASEFVEFMIDELGNRR